MSIEKANFEVILKKINEIKSVTPFVLSNIFFDYNELHDILKKKECLFLENKYAVFILIPYHDSFYDILYTCLNTEYLKCIINDFKLLYNKKWQVRVSVIGKEPQTGNIASLFEDSGFSLGKKLARIMQKRGSEEVQKAIHSIEANSETLESNSDVLEELTASFAVAGDEKEILSILLEEFDVCDDNIPEIEDIIKNINKNNIVVIKSNGVIACLAYFEIKNGKCYGLYNVTRREYRNKFLLFEIGKFMQEYFAKINITINRQYGWIDTANKRLMKFVILNNKIPDGVYIYNMKWSVNAVV